MAVPYAPPPPDPRRTAAAIGTVVVTLFLAWQALAQRAWINADTRPPAWDRSTHLELALEVRDLKAAMRPPVKPDSPPFPPLYYLAMQPLMKKLPPAQAALWLNWFYLAALGYSVLALALYFRPDLAAPACALLVLAAPGVQELLHAHLLDLGVMAWVALAYAFLVYSDGFRRWPASIGFALAFGLGMLHKWSVFMYLTPALYQAMRSLERPDSRAPAGAALLLALGLPAPWYVMNAVSLWPRLWAASGGFDAMAFSGKSGLFYLKETVAAMGPLFWLFGLIGLMVPQYHRAVGQGWLMTAWFVSSYVLWTVVPNRLVRFMLPAAPSLALAGTGAWPMQLLWALAAVQVLGAFNYNHGWISEIKVPMPFLDVSFFPSDPPRDEDWAIESALRMAAEKHQLDHPVAGMTVIADHPRLNIHTLAFAARRLGLIVEPRPGDAQGLSLTEFVFFKTGTQSPEVALIKDPKSWFSRAYDELDRWPLPDGSEAVLYQQGRFTEATLRENSSEFQFYRTPNGVLEAEEVKLRLGPWDPMAGGYRTAQLSGSAVKYKGLDLGAVEIEMRNVLLAPSYGKSGVLEELRVLRLGELEIKKAKVSVGALKLALETYVPGLQLQLLDIGGLVTAVGRYRGVAVNFTAKPVIGASNVALDVQRAKIGPLNVSPAVMGALARFEVPLRPTVEKPFLLKLAGLTPSAGSISIP